MNCAYCKKILRDNCISAAGKDFCSDVCHLRFWKEEMPNLGGRWILDEDIQRLGQLQGQKREELYSKIVGFIMENFDNTYFILMLQHGKEPNEPEEKLDN